MSTLTMFVGFVLVSAVIWAFGIYQETRRDEAWQEIADELGGELVDTGSGWFSGDSSKALHLVIDGVSLRMDSYSEVRGSGKSRKRVYFQRVRVKVDGSFGHTALIYKETAFFSSLGKALGGQDVIIGDMAFDDAFIIKSDDANWMQQTLGVAAAAGARRAHLGSRAERVELNASGLLTCTRQSRGGDTNVVRAQLDLAMHYVRAFSPHLALGQAHEPPRLASQDLPPGPPPGAAW